MEQIIKIKPTDIEKESMRLIEEEMGPVSLDESEKLVLKRVIHTTADFDYVKNLKFSENAVKEGLKALKEGAVIVTDTNMAKTGISKPACKSFGCTPVCFIAEEDVARKAKERGVTRASISMEKAAEEFKDKKIIFAIGNAPTALITIRDLMDQGKLNPALVIGAPVGFVNVVASKEYIMDTNVSYIVAAGRKGGSNVAAAIVNAMLYQLYNREEH